MVNTVNEHLHIISINRTTFIKIHSQLNEYQGYGKLYWKINSMNTKRLGKIIVKSMYNGIKQNLL